MIAFASVYPTHHISPIRFNERTWELIVNKNTLNFNTICRPTCQL